MAATEAVPDSASKEALDNLHHHLHELQEEQDRLADFARKLAEEIAVKEDHIKVGSSCNKNHAVVPYFFACYFMLLIPSLLGPLLFLLETTVS